MLMTKTVTAYWKENPEYSLDPELIKTFHEYAKELEIQGKTDNIVEVLEDGLVRQRKFLNQEAADSWVTFGLAACAKFPGTLDLLEKYEINNITN